KKKRVHFLRDTQWETHVLKSIPNPINTPTLVVVDTQDTTQHTSPPQSLTALHALHPLRPQEAATAHPSIEHLATHAASFIQHPGSTAMAQGQAARATREAVPPVSRVAIIGGGISGLAAAKQMAAYDPVVFEATPSVGGVWKHCVYRTTRLQTPRPDYEFSDYSWKNRDDPSFPTHTEIVD
uniref:Flavin-containing monooxygenase n=1 Tax=Aegilops tauschii subsp. strangulata TaxID=200361 RepID=A0A453IXD4_AEGTS